MSWKKLKLSLRIVSSVRTDGFKGLCMQSLRVFPNIKAWNRLFHRLIKAINWTSFKSESGDESNLGKCTKCKLVTTLLS